MYFLEYLNRDDYDFKKYESAKNNNLIIITNFY